MEKMASDQHVAGYKPELISEIKVLAPWTYSNLSQSIETAR